MLIVLGLIGVLSSVIMARYQSFDSTTLLRNLAFEVALSVREAQIMTISTSNQGGSIQTSFGVYFTAASNNFVIFADKNGNDVYESATEFIKTVSLPQGASVKRLCVNTDSGMKSCDRASVTVTFDRPHLNTSIKSTPSATIQSAEIELQSRRGGVRTVIIDKSSRIEVAP